MVIKAKLTNVPKEVAEKLLELENVAITKKDSGYVVETNNLEDFSKAMESVNKN